MSSAASRRHERIPSRIVAGSRARDGTDTPGSLLCVVSALWCVLCAGGSLTMAGELGKLIRI